MILTSAHARGAKVVAGNRDQHAGQVDRKTGSGRSELHFRVVRLCISAKIAQIFGRQIWAHDEKCRLLGDQNNRGEIGGCV